MFDHQFQYAGMVSRYLARCLVFVSSVALVILLVFYSPVQMDVSYEIVAESKGIGDRGNTREPDRDAPIQIALVGCQGTKKKIQLKKSSI